MAVHGVKVSVVVPVYNPGARIDGLIGSLAGQSLPQHEFEVIFVDDGSTDDTPERLEAACARHANMRTTRIPNSGWPGRPRNVGTDLAEGEFVFYADNDDELFAESLERLYAMAVANDSDIVYGKVVRSGRTTPYWPLWRQNVPVADPVKDRVCLSRTVHKLFRRQFLVDHAIRFPEGRVRLEDFAFMGQAIPQAKVISILADYPIYRWIHDPGGTNSSSQEVEADRYWGYFAEALQIMADHAGEGELLDDARGTATQQTFSRFAPEAYLARAQEGQQELVRSVQETLQAQVPDRLDARLPVFKRVRVVALRAGDKQRFDALQRLRTELSFDLVTEEMAWQDGRLHLAVRASLSGPDSVCLVEPAAEPDGPLRLPRDARLWPDEDDVRELRGEDCGQLELTVRHRGTGIEWPVQSSATVETTTVPGGAHLGVRVRAVIDPQSGFFGEPLDDGTWDVMARVQFLGEGAAVGVPAPRQLAGPRAAGNRTARLKASAKGRLQLSLGYEAVAGRSTTPLVVGTAWKGGQLRLTLANTPDFGSSVITRHVAGGDGVEVPVTRGVATLSLDHVREGQVVDAYVRLYAPGAVRDQRLVIGTSMTLDPCPPFAVLVDQERGLSLRRLGPRDSAGQRVSVDVRARRGPRSMLARAAGRLPGPLHRLAKRLSKRLSR